jgi:hypothetical protein
VAWILPLVAACLTLPYQTIWGADPPKVDAAQSPCEDKIPGTVNVAPDLRSKLFTTLETSYPWYIVGEEGGKLEDTMDGTITEEDLVRLEHTSSCISTHQGEHVMSYCDATATPDGGVALVIHGGLPAYASGLTVTMDAANHFTCAFQAVYPGPTASLRWRITKKTLRAKSLQKEAGRRFYAWLSVEFDEVWTENGSEQKRSYKIEGHVKPVIQHAKKAE